MLFRRISALWRFALLLATALHVASTDAQNGPLHFEDVAIETFVTEMALRTGRTFVVDPRVQGKVRIVSPEYADFSQDDLWRLFRSALEVNGFSLVAISDRQYRIVPVALALRGGALTERPASVLRVFTLASADAREVVPAIERLLGEGGTIAALPSANAVIIGDTPANMERVADAIDGLDARSDSFFSITLSYLHAEEAVKLVNRLYAQNRAISASAVGDAVLVIDAPREIFTKIARLIKDIDKAPEGGEGLRVFALSYGDAKKLTKTVTDLLGTKPDVRLVFDEESNSIVAHAPPAEMRMIEAVLRSLDSPSPQVLVEAVIVQLSDEKSRELGIQYLHSYPDAGVFSTSSFAGDGVPGILNVAAAAYLNSAKGVTLDPSVTASITQGAVSSLLGTRGFRFGGLSNLGDGSYLGVLLDAIETDTHSNILSTPSIITLDNQEALIQVGQNIPVITGESQNTVGDNIFRQVTREDIGIILKIKPRINDNGTVRLRIEQEVSSINEQSPSAQQGYLIEKIVMQSNAMVRDGDFLVIGGLIDDTSRRVRRKVPVLGDMPLVGPLFRSSGRRNARRNLVVFIRPRVLYAKEDADALTAASFRRIGPERLITGRSVEESLADLLSVLPPEWYKKGERSADGP